MSFLLTMLVFCPIYSFSQTKQETEEWLLSKLNTYSNSGLSLTRPSFQKTVRFSISGSKLIGRDGDLMYTIDIKNIQDYTYSIMEGFKDDDFGSIPPMVTLKLTCRGGNCVTSYFDGSSDHFPHLQIFMDDNFKNDNLPGKDEKGLQEFGSVPRRSICNRKVLINLELRDNVCKDDR